jgi:dTDP-4-amino-4,6-dideoxygalactose transaminase
VDIEKIEQFTKEHDLTIIEDLAHCAGVRYADGREAGTVGAAAVLSFGKDKSIDTISGGAVVLRYPYKNPIKAPSKHPKISDHLRARFYPFFGALCRKLSYVHLGGVLMKLLLAIHWVEKSADNKLDLERRPSKFEAKRALMQIKSLSRTGEKPLRTFYIVKEREKLLKELKEAGYYFDGFWYEKPVSPARYYKKVHFPEKDCPNAVYAAEHIVNLPRYYRKKNLEPAIKIIKKYLEKTA